MAGRGEVGDILLEGFDTVFRLGQFVQHRNPRHDDEAVVADFAETALEADYRAVEALGERH